MAKETKVILTDTVTDLGHKGDVVGVKPGYARNFLIPQGLAFAWSKGAAAQIESLQRARPTMLLPRLFAPWLMSIPAPSLWRPSRPLASSRQP